MPGTSQGGREVVHLRVPGFFAAIEQQDNPELARRPVAVGAGVVSSCSIEAQRHGVRPAMPTAEARHRCPGLVVVPDRPARYEQAARHLRDLARECSPAVEAVALDSLSLDFSHTPAGTRNGLRWHLLNRIRAEMGLDVLLGAGSTRLVAQLASGRASPGEPHVVPAGHEPAFLAPHSVRVLPGMTDALARRLERYNVARVGEMAAMPAELVRQLFGAAGERLLRHARGIDPRPVLADAYPEHIQRWLSFAAPLADRSRLAAVLDYLLDQAACWMRSLDLAADGLGVTLQYSDGKPVTGQARFREPTQRDAPLRLAAQAKLAHLYRRRLPLRLVVLALTPLRPAERQASLFSEVEGQRTSSESEIRGQRSEVIRSHQKSEEPAAKHRRLAPTSDL